MTWARTWVAVAVLATTGGLRAQEPAAPTAYRILVPGLAGNVPAEVRARTAGAARDAVDAQLGERGRAVDCDGIAAMLMGAGLETDACKAGRLSLEERGGLDITHVLGGDLMRVDKTHYLTLRLFPRASSAARVEVAGSGASAEAALRDALAQLGPALTRELRLPPPPAAGSAAPATKPRKTPRHAWILLERTGGAARFDWAGKEGAPLRDAVTTWTQAQGGTWSMVDSKELSARDGPLLAEDGTLRMDTARAILKARDDGRLVAARLVLTQPVPGDNQVTVHGLLQARVFDAAGALLANVEREVDLTCETPRTGERPCTALLARDHLPALLTEAWSTAAAAPTSDGKKAEPAPR